MWLFGYFVLAVHSMTIPLYFTLSISTQLNMKLHFIYNILSQISVLNLNRKCQCPGVFSCQKVNCSKYFFPSKCQSCSYLFSCTLICFYIFVSQIRLMFYNESVMFKCYVFLFIFFPCTALPWMSGVINVHLNLDALKYVLLLKGILINLLQMEIFLKC